MDKLKEFYNKHKKIIKIALPVMALLITVVVILKKKSKTKKKSLKF